MFHFIFYLVFNLFLLIDEGILKNSRKASTISSPDAPGNFLELDFWIPDLKLAFEFQVSQGGREKAGDCDELGRGRGRERREERCSVSFNIFSFEGPSSLCDAMVH